MGGREVGGMSFCVRYAAVPPCIMPATFRFNVRKGGCKERREKDGTSQHMSSVTIAPAERNATVVGFCLRQRVLKDDTPSRAAQRQGFQRLCNAEIHVGI